MTSPLASGNASVGGGGEGEEEDGRSLAPAPPREPRGNGGAPGRGRGGLIRAGGAPPPCPPPSASSRRSRCLVRSPRALARLGFARRGARSAPRPRRGGVSAHQRCLTLFIYVICFLNGSPCYFGGGGVCGGLKGKRQALPDPCPRPSRLAGSAAEGTGGRAEIP